MPKSFLAVIFIFCMLNAYSQNPADGRVLIRGVIKDTTQKTVSYAHILNKNRNEGWVSDYYGTFRASAFPGDTLIISAVSFHYTFLVIPQDVAGSEYLAEVIVENKIVDLNEVVIWPWPATLAELKREIMEVEIEDPADDIDLHLPSLKDLDVLARTPGVPGQIGLYSGPGPFSMLYNQFSKEAKSKRIYAELVYKEKAGKKYNKAVVSKITGLKNDDEILKFMEFCALQIKFILDSTDYELYAAILGCFNDYCERGYGPVQGSE